jgi:hypothetical protein
LGLRGGFLFGDLAMTEALAKAIKADLLKAKQDKTIFPECFACGRTYSKSATTSVEPWGFASERFCSDRCRHGYDNGGPVHNPNHVGEVTDAPPRSWKVAVGPPMASPRLAPGVEIGANYYTPVLDAIEHRQSRRRLKDNPTEPPRPKPKCQRCSKPLPVWIKGKRVRKDRKYCLGCQT